MIKRNQRTVEKLHMEISCRITLISQTQLDDEKDIKPERQTSTLVSDKHTIYLSHLISSVHVACHIHHSKTPLVSFHNHQAITYNLLNIYRTPPFLFFFFFHTIYNFPALLTCARIKNKIYYITYIQRFSISMYYSFTALH